MSTRPRRWTKNDTYLTGAIFIENELGAFVASVSTVESRKRADADADLIVLAVNTHHDLVAELASADKIILAMLGAMTPAQKAKVAAQLEETGVSPDGMTRHHERRTALAKAEAQ